MLITDSNNLENFVALPVFLRHFISALLHEAAPLAPGGSELQEVVQI